MHATPDRLLPSLRGNQIILIIPDSLLKLQQYGISNGILNWIYDFLYSRSRRVVLDATDISEVPVTSGVPQGTVLGLLHFIVYINDLPKRVSSTVRLFADDCLLYCMIRDVTDTRTLQADLDRIQEWEAEWLMEFNPSNSKCKVITISKTKISADAVRPTLRDVRYIYSGQSTIGFRYIFCNTEKFIAC